MSKTIEKTCAFCGKKYNAKRANSKTCSNTCRVKLHFERKMDAMAAYNADKALRSLFTPLELEKVKDDMQRARGMMSENDLAKRIAFIELMYADHFQTLAENRILKKHFGLNEKQFSEIIDSYWPDDTPLKIERALNIIHKGHE